jgi:hypothetical protein
MNGLHNDHKPAEMEPHLGTLNGETSTIQYRDPFQKHCGQEVDYFDIVNAYIGPGRRSTDHE